MAITDYASLQSGVIAWLNRTGDADATANVATWIQLAEDEIFSELATSPLRQGEQNNQAFAISTEYTALPSGFLRARDITIQGSPPQELDYITPSSVNRLGILTGSVGKPQKYTIQGNQLRVIPAPDSAYTATFNYQALAALSGSNTTNWLLTLHPKIYLFATLAEADRYYRDPDGFTADTSIWKGLFAKAFAADGPSAAGGSLQMRTDNGNP